LSQARIIGAFPSFTAPRLLLRSFVKNRVLVQLHELFWYAAASEFLYRIDNDYCSVEQGWMQVHSTQIDTLLQTPVDLVLPSMMFVTVLVSHRFFGNANPAEQVAAREHPAYLMSCLRLSRIGRTGRVDRLGVSASEGACAYLLIWLYIPCTISSTVNA
jgi:hypothetical protein